MPTTTNYELPHINPAAAFNGANDINAIATATDAALKKVSDEADAITYTLPAATGSTLGGIIAGTNVSVADDGTISTPNSDYTLPAATADTLGGVKVPSGSGFDLASDGTLSIKSAELTLPDDSVATSQIVNGAVTTAKIADGAVTKDKMSPALQAVINDNTNWVNGAGSTITPTFIDTTNNPDPSAMTVSNWGNVIMISCSTVKVVCPSTPTDNIDFAKTPFRSYIFANYSSNLAIMGQCSSLLPLYDSSNALTGYAYITAHLTGYDVRGPDLTFNINAAANLVPGTTYNFSGSAQIIVV